MIDTNELRIGGKVMSLSNPIEPMSEDTAANLAISTWELQQANKELRKVMCDFIDWIEEENGEKI